MICGLIVSLVTECTITLLKIHGGDAQLFSECVQDAKCHVCSAAVFHFKTYSDGNEFSFFSDVTRGWEMFLR